MPVDGQIAWHRLAAGSYVGFRPLGGGAGSWWARATVDGRRKYGRLDGIDRLQPARQYDAAAEAARKWIEHVQNGGASELETVEDACRAYVESFDSEEKRTRMFAHLRRSVLNDPLAKTKLNDLRPRHIEDWRKRIVAMPVRVGRGVKLRERERSLGTINATMSPLRAALNRALERGEIATDMAWRRELKPIPGALRPRELLLSSKDREALLEHASDVARPFIEALTLLPVRPGAMAALTVADWDGRASTLRIPKDKAHAGRRFKVPASVAAFLTTHCRGKLPAAPIFADALGRPWTRHTWKDEVRTAAQAAGLPAEATAYSLRHSLLTEIIDGGAPLAVVAKVAGTSATELNRTYHHLTDEASVAALELIG